MTEHTSTTEHHLAERYFALAAGSDTDAYVALFDDDAVVEDDGHRYRGTGAIRDWRTSVPAVTYRVRAVRPRGDGVRAVTEIAGDFPGSPVTLAFEFATAGGRIRALTIRPASG